MIIAHQQFVNAVYQVIYITKAAGLRSIAKYRQVFAPQCLSNKGRQGTAVIAPHTRTIGIEDADNARFYSMKSMISHGDGFLETLGFIVHASRTHGIYVAPVLFILRMHQRVAIDL